MPRPKSTQAPTYTLHKPSGRARVRLNGRDIYLGEYGTPESREAYHRIIAEWERHGRQAPPVNADLAIRETTLRAQQAARATLPELSVNETALAYIRHAEAYYRKGDRTTKELERVKSAAKPLVRLYGLTPAAEFGPLALKAVRDVLLAEGKLARVTVNRDIDHIRRMFKWAVENEMVPPTVYQALAAVARLKRGRTKARETKKVRPVAEAAADAIRPHVAKQVAAMVKLQMLTGMRPGEVCIMRACDIGMNGPLWLFRPAEHKLEHHEIDREIVLGPQAQAIVKPFLTLNREKYLFSPADAENGRREGATERRRTPANRGNRPGSNRKRRPRRQPGNRYDVASYRRAIERGCDLAFPPPEHLRKHEGETGAAWAARLEKDKLADELTAWRKAHRWHPNQLRHTYATRIRREYGIEAARVMLGHQHVGITEVYAEQNRAVAVNIAAKVG